MCIRDSACAAAWNAVREARAELARLDELAGARERELDLLEFELREIEELDPQPDEREAHVIDRDRLRNVEGLRLAAAAAEQALAGDEAGALAGLVAARSSLDGVRHVDPELAVLAERAGALALEGEDLLSDLRHYADGLEAVSYTHLDVYKRQAERKRRAARQAHLRVRARPRAGARACASLTRLGASGIGRGGPGRGARAGADHRLHLHANLVSSNPKQRLLDGVDGPADLHPLNDAQLAQLAQEVREHIIDTVGEIGGHFGANLGTCELAVALHSLLDSPRDKIIWDVGHQAYPHKVLTGRRDRLETIRKYGGLAPFCSIAESEHDIIGAGHASTSIGYAVGMKEAMRHGLGDDARVVAVIGDGAMTGGVAFEAISQAGGLGTPIVVVLNDNGMSIAPNVGALSRYFNRVRLNPRLWHAREGVEGGLTKLPVGIGSKFERLGPQLKESIKAFWAPGLWWEELDWAYTGVIDGHDVRALRVALREALAAQRPVVVHIATVKGKGFAPAEDGGLEGMERWHAAKPQSILDGEPTPAVKRSGAPRPPQYTTVFGEALVAECRRDKRVIGITAAMNSGTGLNILQEDVYKRQRQTPPSRAHRPPACRWRPAPVLCVRRL